jgi:hypothetical protein
MRLHLLLLAVNRFRLFLISAVILIFGAVLRSINPDISDLPVVIASLAFGAAMAEDWYRCKYNDKPTIMFKTEEEFKEIMKKDITQYPLTKYWYKITGRLDE